VAIPGYGRDKINSTTVYGGPELTLKVVSQLLDTPVDSYVMVDFNGFKNIVDALGGVTVDVDRRMYHADRSANYAYQIDLKKGEQRLDGAKALQFIRFRDYPMGDIERLENQQKLFIALGREALQPATILKLPTLIPEVARYTKTNLSPADLLKLTKVLTKLEEGNFVSQTLPGRLLDVGGGSYWEAVKPEEARQVLTNLFNGETEPSVRN
jgi:LCP family protein required for cell wall assembly